LSHPKTYAVIIPYREPTYELRRGAPLKSPYTARYEVEASTRAEAIELAIDRFKQTARDSSVGWVKEIEHAAIRVEPGSG
jgi:hypothetical protein